MIRVVSDVEATLFYCLVEHDVPGSLPDPWDHTFLSESIPVQLLLAFCGQNAANEWEGVTVVAVAVFFTPVRQPAPCSEEVFQVLVPLAHQSRYARLQ